MAFVGGEGIAAFQLSNLQTEWSRMTWLCFAAFYLSFLIGYDYKEYRDVTRNKKKRANGKILDGAVMERPLLVSIIAVAAVALAAFVLEAFILGYVPLFSKDTHAYNYFHVTGIHYFTVTCMMTHALTLIFLMVHKENCKSGSGKKLSKGVIILLIIANIAALSIAILCISKFQFLLTVNIAALSIAILCISKFQFLLTVALPFFIYLMMKKDINVKRLAIVGGGIGVVVVLVMAVMIMRRNYEPGYLNDIFEMKNPDLPMFVQYPYIYVANNYANFNCLVEQMTQHTMGLRMAFPLFALTGLKFISPFREWLIQPVYLTKTELNTLTIIYDAYYDFGLAGVILLGVVLGWTCAFLTKKMKEGRNPIIYLFGGQIAVYVALSFFSTWFSVSTTWFWLGVTGVIYWYVGRCGIGKMKSKELKHEENS